MTKFKNVYMLVILLGSLFFSSKQVSAAKTHYEVEPMIQLLSLKKYPEMHKQLHRLLPAT